MQIEYRKGDLFTTDIKAILHGCNAQGVMNSGVAKIVREEYPAAYENYRDIYNSATDKFLSSLPLGEVYPVETKGKLILNAITQEKYGYDGKRYVSYNAVAKVMARIDRMYPDLTEVAMPKLGSGLAGGDWNVIAAIIESELTSVKPVVYTL